jgi:hypothetical protein
MKTPTTEKPKLELSDAAELKELNKPPTPPVCTPGSPPAPQSPPVTSVTATTGEPPPNLGQIYAAIDAAPPEWLPSLLAKVVKRSLKSGAWSSVENLILSVRGFSK